jgi:hypothetical protein
MDALTGRRKRGLPEKAKAPLGSGERFAALKSELSGRPGVTNPGGLAAYIGRKKYGKARFQGLAKGGLTRGQ